MRYVYKKNFACDTGELYKINLSSNYDTILTAQQIFSRINTLRDLYVFAINAQGDISFWGTRIAHIPGIKGSVSINQIVTKIVQITKRSYPQLSFDDKFCGCYMSMNIDRLEKESARKTENFLRQANFISALLLKINDFVFEFRVFTGFSNYRHGEFYLGRDVIYRQLHIDYPFILRVGAVPGEMERRVTISVKKHNGEISAFKFYDFEEQMRARQADQANNR